MSSSTPEKEFFPFQGIKRDIFHFANALLENTGDFLFRSIKGFNLVVAVEELSEVARRRKRIESESRGGMLYKRQEKAMEKTITKLCLMLAMLHLVRMADAMAIESKGR